MSMSLFFVIGQKLFLFILNWNFRSLSWLIISVLLLCKQGHFFTTFFAVWTVLSFSIFLGLNILLTMKNIKKYALNNKIFVVNSETYYHLFLSSQCQIIVFISIISFSPLFLNITKVLHQLAPSPEYSKMLKAGYFVQTLDMKEYLLNFKIKI